MDIFRGDLGLVTYLGLKGLGYVAWCFVGVRWVGARRKRPALVGLGLGLGRMVLGWFVGLAVAPFVLFWAGLGQLPVFYFTGLVLVRWLEWGVIHWLLRPEDNGGLFMTGGNARGRAWRAGGIVVSYLADAPFLLTEGFPHGRFLC